MLKYIMVLSVIIPTFNGKHLLEKNLPFLFDALKNVKGEREIIIVDNGSTDNTERLVNGLTSSRVNGLMEVNIKYIVFQTNKGFTGAVNEGVRNVSGTYILILNNDCRLEEDTVKKMVDALEEHKEWVATQPIIYKLKIKNEKLKITNKNSKIEKEKIIENIGYKVDLWKGKAETVCKLKIKNEKLKIGKNIFQHRYLYGLSGTCLLMKRDIFLEIGMLDETFHSYLEDVDLFIRLAKQGYQYYPTLSATCLHDHMATSSTMGNYKEKQDVKNWMRIILKNYSLVFILRHFPALCMERLRNISGLVKKSVRMTL